MSFQPTTIIGTTIGAMALMVAAAARIASFFAGGGGAANEQDSDCRPICRELH
jgi:hypothetical protein